MTVRLFLVDEYPLYRSGVRVAVQADGDVQVVGEASTGNEAVRLLRNTTVDADVVLMEVDLPDISGIDAARTIVADSEARGTPPPRVLMVSASDAGHAVVAAMRAGTSGYLAKGASHVELLQAVRIAAAGGAVFSPNVARRLGEYFSVVHEYPSHAAFPTLTDRERQVLDLIARGCDNRRIARQLVLSEKTIRNHVTHLFGKLQVKDRATAAVRAREAGMG
ncbi:LuxR C-terminal-related transcriptional regulator [Actinophytocola oryzae]|uniref:DNA-binding NarL/FixJ family response regulator n=1 Tax=Actinophytocola oryzae TaxID=502181 RepID=A0A4R7VKK4_9PSEU|nr:response regulator transcription factor [Actinophytocola oryzae]TDV49679.1 DNA-binding NarL/FixJ family response regulator [Actinophytocola oryzae]